VELSTLHDGHFKQAKDGDTPAFLIKPMLYETIRLFL
jgi:hypothetical protein